MASPRDVFMAELQAAVDRVRSTCGTSPEAALGEVLAQMQNPARSGRLGDIRSGGETGTFNGATIGGPVGINSTYQQADAEHLAAQVARWGLPGEHVLTVWGRIESLAKQAIADHVREVDARAQGIGFAHAVLRDSAKGGRLG